MFTWQVQEWLVRNRKSPELEDVMWEAWNSIDALPDHSTKNALNNTKLRIGHPMLKSRRLMPVGISIAAAVAAAVMLVVSLDVHNRTREIATVNTIEYVVPDGEIGSLALPDGTTVSLNAGSVLIYPDKFNGNGRNVYLSGEGFFNVAKDESKPFVVKTSRMDITALGTSFNVHAYPGSGRMVATLNSGKITVADNSEKDPSLYVLTPDQQIECDLSSGEVTRRVIDAGEVSGWRDGNIYFHSMQLSQIIPSLERRFGVDIRVNAEINQQECYTLKFQNNEGLEYILSVLMSASDGYMYSIEDTIINIYKQQM